MKNKLLNAMKSLPMTIEDKQEFVNTIVNNTKGGGESVLYYYKFNSNVFIEEYESLAGGTINGDTAFMLMDLITGVATYIWYDDDDSSDRNILIRQINMSEGVSPIWYFYRIKGIIVEDCSLVNYPYFVKGEYKQKFEKLSNVDASFEEIMPIIEVINKHLTPVTKEEFYADFVTKPIIL